MGLEWETDQKTSSSRDTVDTDASIVAFDHSAYDVEAHSCSLTNTFRGEEWFKDAALDVGGNAWPVVFDVYTEIISLPVSPDSEAAVVLLAESIQSVNDEVGPHLVEFASEGFDKGQLTVPLFFQVNALIEF